MTKTATRKTTRRKPVRNMSEVERHNHALRALRTHAEKHGKDGVFTGPPSSQKVLFDALKPLGASQDAERLRSKLVSLGLLTCKRVGQRGKFRYTVDMRSPDITEEDLEALRARQNGTAKQATAAGEPNDLLSLVKRLEEALTKCQQRCQDLEAENQGLRAVQEEAAQYAEDVLARHQAGVETAPSTTCSD